MTTLTRPGAVAAVSVRNVSVEFNGVRALREVDLDVAAGQIVAVVGPNGAGKTTLLDVISGIVPAQEGSIVVAGEDVAALPAEQRVAHGLGRGFQDARLFPSLTVAETLVLATSSRDGAARTLTEFGLSEWADAFVDELSCGMRRVLELAVASARSPSVLLLDEPASGLAQGEVEELGRLIHQWRERTGAAILLVEHNLALVRIVADEVVVLDAGRVTGRGTAEALLAVGAGAHGNGWAGLTHTAADVLSVIASARRGREPRS